MPGMQRELGERRPLANNTRVDSPNDIQPLDLQQEPLDAVVVGAGFAGCYILHRLRQKGFSAKIVEAGTGLGGIWHWNTYPGARVDSQYPIYAFSLPEVYEDWNWSSHYPGGEELREYFEHVDKKLEIKKDTVFGTKVVRATFVEERDVWVLECDTGAKFVARHFIASLGFAAKRHFPDWEGLEDFEGVIHHSSFWPEEGIDVKDKKCAVVGTGATGVQITQEWAHEIGDEGELKMFQRTPNLACPMNQVWLSEEEQVKDKLDYPKLFDQRFENFNGFLYQIRPEVMLEQTDEDRNKMFDMLWKMGGFRFLMNNYYDMNRDLKANRLAYDYWRDHVRTRIKDQRKAAILAPQEPPHPFGAKRLSLEQDFYDSFNKSNVDVVDIKSNPIARFEKNGIRQQDGTFHELDVIALATGFDAITGGIRDIEIRGTGGELLTDKWAKGTYTYLGMMTSRFPNMYFTYGPQGPTAFANGPTCNEVQGDWIVGLMDDMRARGQTRVDCRVEEEQAWRENVQELSSRVVRGKTDSWYNGGNIPGKTREHLVYAGGIPLYMKIIGREKAEGYPGFVVS